MPTGPRSQDQSRQRRKCTPFPKPNWEALSEPDIPNEIPEHFAPDSAGAFLLYSFKEHIIDVISYPVAWVGDTKTTPGYRVLFTLQEEALAYAFCANHMAIHDDLRGKKCRLPVIADLVNLRSEAAAKLISSLYIMACPGEIIPEVMIELTTSWNNFRAATLAVLMARNNHYDFDGPDADASDV